MAVTMTLLRSLARQGHAPSEILRQLNDELLDQNPRGMFVTMQCLVFDLASHVVTCASAGHHGAAHVVPGAAPRMVFLQSGRVLGLMPSGAIPSETLTLQPGESLVLFTDGVSEAFDVRQELFGEQRLLEYLAASPGATARETTTGVLDAVRRHATGAKQSDDITVVSVRNTGE
jgi:phosphoserine phosphatase RsbU/P